MPERDANTINLPTACKNNYLYIQSSNMKVLLIASECAPLVKVGGIADVIGSLPLALSTIGVDARIVIPYYKPLLDAVNFKPIKTFLVNFAGIDEAVSVHETKLSNSNVTVYLLKNDKYLSNGGIYFSPQHMASPDEELDRFAFFSKAVCRIFSYNNEIFNTDIFHCNDWHTGLIPQLLQSMHNYNKSQILKTIFTIHNLAYQGFTKIDIAQKLDININSDQSLKWDATDDNLDMVLQGIIGSDYITTVSEKYAEEIQTSEFGEGLHEILESRKNRLKGILNGISYEVFDPSKDPYIKANYTHGDVISGKQKNKISLQKELDLIENPNIPLIGIISRLASQKGLNLVSDSLEKICESGYQVVLLGNGDPLLEEIFKQANYKPSLKGKYKGLIQFSEKMARKIYASSDMFLIPSKYEPCGLTQMIAMKYGTVPIVRATGGLFDTVSDQETGFSFIEFSSNALLNSIMKASELYKNKENWNRIVQKCMSQDFSWTQSAKKYASLYQKVLNL